MAATESKINNLMLLLLSKAGNLISNNDHKSS